MVAQPHGGAIKQGGNPGNRGGLGNIPSTLRAVARDALADALPHLRLVAIGERVRVSRVARGEVVELEMRPEIETRLEAFDRLDTLGMGEELRTEDIRKRLERQAELLAEALPPALLTAAMQAIAEAWA